MTTLEWVNVLSTDLKVVRFGGPGHLVPNTYLKSAGLNTPGVKFLSYSVQILSVGGRSWWMLSHMSHNDSVNYSAPVLSLSCIFCSISWAEARLVGSDGHSSSMSLKLTDSAYESVTATAAELWDDCLFGMFVWEFSEWGVCFREEPAISSSVLVRLSVDEYCLSLLSTLLLVCGYFLSEAAAAWWVNQVYHSSNLRICLWLH